MTLQDRDKKIIAVMVPVVVLLGFWFLILAPKRAESGKLGTQLTQANAKRDTAVSAAGALEGARNSYAKDYETVVRLGKAVPASLDMPSLLVQLESAAKGTNIEFDSVKAGARTAAAPTTAAPAAGARPAPASLRLRLRLPRLPRPAARPPRPDPARPPRRQATPRTQPTSRRVPRPRLPVRPPLVPPLRLAPLVPPLLPEGLLPRGWTACRWSSPSPAASSTWPTSSTA